jgi:hypothetical protein
LVKKPEQDKFYDHTKGIFNRTLVSIFKVLEIDRELILKSESATPGKIAELDEIIAVVTKKLVDVKLL